MCHESTTPKRAARATAVCTFVLAALSAPSAQAQDPLVAFEQRMQRPDVTVGVNEDFGVAVAVDGNRAIVGAPDSSVAGAAYIYERIGDAWVQQARLAPIDLAVGDRFGESVAIDGNWAVVGAREHAAAGFGAGAAYVFAFNAGVWTQLDKLSSSDPTPNAERFGKAVAVSGTTVAVSSYLHNDVALGNSVGAVWVFERNGASWTQTKLMPSELTTGDQFGTSLALDGDTLIAGAPFHLPGGAVYAYRRVAAGWSFEDKLSVGASPGQYGTELTLDGDQAVVAAVDAVYVYARGASGWAEETPRISLGARVGTGSGIRPVDLHDNRLLASRGAAAEVYVRTATGWVRHARVTVDTNPVASEDGVALTDDGMALVGSSSTTTLSVAEGAVWAFVPRGSSYGLVQKITPSKSRAGNGFGQSIAVVGSEAAVLGMGTSAQLYRMQLSGGAWQQREAVGTFLNVSIVAPVAFTSSTIAFGYMYGNQKNYLRVHERLMNGSWTTQTDLGPGQTDDAFARSLGISGSSMLIGAWADDTVAGNAGALYESTRTGTTWSAPQVVMLGTGANNRFGRVVLHGGDDALVARSNGVVVLRKDSGSWQITQAFSVPLDFYACGAREGNLAVFGNRTTGGAHVFTRSGTTWSHLTTLSSPVASDNFGTEVAVTGNRIAVTSDALDVPGSGVVYVYDLSGNLLQRVATIRPHDQAEFDRFGTALAIAGQDVLVGAPEADEGGQDTGAGYVYTLSPRRSDGELCDAALECVSESCVQGICCDGECSTSCESCAQLWKADDSSDGSCSDAADGLTCGMPNGCFSASQYALPPVCDGAGLCEPRGVSCASAFACVGNRCPDSCQVMGVDTNAYCADTHYCQGGVCVVDKAAGVSCSAHPQCESGSCVGGVCLGKVGDGCASTACAPGAFCVDGYCCDEPCNEQCESCGESGLEGSCVAVTGAPRAGRAACISDSDCGGSCNGTVRDGCSYPSTVACGLAACNAGQLTGNICNGLGACVTGATSSCAPYLQCGSSSACAFSCGTDNQCNASHFCNGIACVPDRMQGDDCDRDGQCATGHCVDGVCCNTECDGQCEACAMSPLDPQAGVCRAVSGDPIEPRPACIGTGTDCEGSCNGATREQCAYPSSNLCGVPSCTGGARTDNVCNGLGSCVTGATSSCTPYLECSSASACATTCAADDQCAATHFCAAGACAVDRTQGQSCMRNAQCATGQCVDGVCCNTECDGQCEACDFGPSDGDRGQCRAVTGEPLGGRAACTGMGSTCGGSCDGVEHEQCEYPSATSCGSSTCSSGIAYGALCDGLGACVINDSGLACFPYAACADATECLSSCGASTQCVDGHYCDDQRTPAACVAQESDSEACSEADQCLSGFCADGVCCNTECTGQCEVCSLGDDDDDAGECRPTPEGSAPAGDRPACSGGESDDDEACAGSCDGAQRDACDYPAQGTACKAASCDGAVLEPERACDGAGECESASTQDCGAYACDADENRCNSRCDSRGDCAAGALCRLDERQCAFVPSVCVDAFTVELADGTQSSCDGHRCAAGVCRERCADPSDCAPEYACVEGECVKSAGGPPRDAGAADASTGPSTAAGGADANALGPTPSAPDAATESGSSGETASEDSGCSCRVPGAPRSSRSASGGALVAVLAALLLRVRRRRTVSP